MSEQKNAHFLPFHAINDFMLDEFRQDVLRSILEAGDQLPPAVSARLNGAVKRHVQVPGFRNSLKAPTTLKLRSITRPFEKSPDLVAAVLAAWVELNGDLRQKVFDLLAARGWELLPLEADRTRLPGFFTRWPVDENYETVYAALQQAHPADDFSQDHVSLMSVWLSMRLPLENSSSEAELSGEGETA